MKNHKEKRLIQELLEPAGIQIDGTEPFDIHVHNPDFYPEVVEERGLRARQYAHRHVRDRGERLGDDP